MLFMNRFLPRAKRYFKENLGALFVIGFQILLFCTSLLIVGNSAWAEEVAVIAFFSLVIGVVLQLTSFLRHGKEGDAENE